MPRLFFAPVDLVEDRTRTRLVGVCAIFTMYLFIGAPLVTRRPDPPYVLTSSVTLPAIARARDLHSSRLSERCRARA